LAKSTPNPIGTNNRGSYFLNIPRYRRKDAKASINNDIGSLAKSPKAVISHILFNISNGYS